jgi:tRNA A37 threonylcarbamoyladenosine modification protein TsaB
MAWLFLDTHAPGEARFAILEDGKLPQVTTIQGRTVGLLPKLAKTMGSKGLKKIEGVCVVAGPGSFSSVRAGVLDANMIARLLNLPLIGITVDEAHDLPVLSHQLTAGIWKHKASSYVAPIYDKEPNITIPKKP